MRVGTAPSSLTRDGCWTQYLSQTPIACSSHPHMGLSRQWDIITGEAFCLCPSGTALAGQSPAILLYTFSSRQQDAAFQCHGIPLKTRVKVQFCRSSQGQLIQTLQKSSPFNYFGSMGENNTYWSYGDSLPASNITCSL